MSCQTIVFSINVTKFKAMNTMTPRQLSSINTPAKIDMSINRYPEIGDDGVAGTDNDASGSISMSMIFELQAVAEDISILRIVFINKILHLQISFVVLITFSLFLPISFFFFFACWNNSSYS